VLRLRFADFSRATRSHTLPHPTARTQAVLDAARALLAEATPLIERRGLTLMGLAVANVLDDLPMQLSLPLEGDDGGAEVELEAATSGHYSNQLGGKEYRFVSQPVSMINDYYPGPQPRFVTKWEFADAASYLAPTPYTNWTLTVKQGDWQDATGIDLTLSGVLLQNPS
jgi:hypothetical protein